MQDNDGELHDIFYVNLPPFANTWPFHPQATPMLIVSMDLIRRAENGHAPEVTPGNSYRLLAFRHADIFNNDLNATLINHVEEVIPECVVVSNDLQVIPFVGWKPDLKDSKGTTEAEQCLFFQILLLYVHRESSLYLHQ